MASIAATATGFGTSDTMPRTFTAPFCCNTLASPIAVASSHQRERSVSMTPRGPVGAGAVPVGARVVDGPRPDDADEPEEHPADAIAATSMAATTRVPVDARRFTLRVVAVIAPPRPARESVAATIDS